MWAIVVLDSRGAQCYCPRRVETIVQVPVSPTGATWLRRAVVASVILHAVAGLIAWKVIGTSDTDVSEVETASLQPNTSRFI